MSVLEPWIETRREIRTELLFKRSTDGFAPGTSRSLIMWHTKLVWGKAGADAVVK